MQLLAVAAVSATVNILAGALVLPQLASNELSAALARTLLALGHSGAGQASGHFLLVLL